MSDVERRQLQSDQSLRAECRREKAVFFGVQNYFRLNYLLIMFSIVDCDRRSMYVFRFFYVQFAAARSRASAGSEYRVTRLVS